MYIRTKSRRRFENHKHWQEGARVIPVDKFACGSDILVQDQHGNVHFIWELKDETQNAKTA